MREFRVWDEMFNHMAYQLPDGYRLNLNGKIALVNEHGKHHTYSDDFTLMQSTGLKDMNGTLIFEGDILHQLDPVIYNPFVVEYSDQSASFIAGGGLSKISIKKDELVIIGNIHENPELLEASK